eukprot:1402860-Ditylum_brightwellii.AAC.1
MGGASEVVPVGYNDGFPFGIIARARPAFGTFVSISMVPGADKEIVPLVLLCTDGKYCYFTQNGVLYN